MDTLSEPERIREWRIEIVAHPDLALVETKDEWLRWWWRWSFVASDSHANSIMKPITQRLGQLDAPVFDFSFKLGAEHDTDS